MSEQLMQTCQICGSVDFIPIYWDEDLAALQCNECGKLFQTNTEGEITNIIK